MFEFEVRRCHLCLSLLAVAVAVALPAAGASAQQMVSIELRASVAEDSLSCPQRDSGGSQQLRLCCFRCDTARPSESVARQSSNHARQCTPLSVGVFLTA